MVIISGEFVLITVTDAVCLTPSCSASVVMFMFRLCRHVLPLSSCSASVVMFSLCRHALSLPLHPVICLHEEREVPAISLYFLQINRQ